jgi:hypothetical protein
MASSSVEPPTATRTARPRLGCFLSLFCSVTHLVPDHAPGFRPKPRGPCPLCEPRNCRRPRGHGRQPSVPHRVHSVRLTILWLAPIGSGRPTLVGSRCRQNRRSLSAVKVWRQTLPITSGGCEPTPNRACGCRPLLLQTVCSRRSPPRRATRRTRPWPACTPAP